jgi:hypothetical protein
VLPTCDIGAPSAKNAEFFVIKTHLSRGFRSNARQLGGAFIWENYYFPTELEAEVAASSITMITAVTTKA